MSRVRAFTLLEVIMAAGLAALLLTLCIAVLVPLARATARSTDQVDLRQMAYATLDRLAADLSRSAPEGISIAPGPVVAIQPLVDLTADGVQVWDTQLVTYFVSAGRVYRRMWPPAPPDLGWVPNAGHPQHLAPAELARLVVPAGTPVLAGFVESLDIQGGTPPLFAQPLKLTLKLKRPEGMTYQLSTSVYLRNAAKKN